MPELEVKGKVIAKAINSEEEEFKEKGATDNEEEYFDVMEAINHQHLPEWVKDYSKE